MLVTRTVPTQGSAVNSTMYLVTQLVSQSLVPHYSLLLPSLKLIHTSPAPAFPICHCPCSPLAAWGTGKAKQGAHEDTQMAGARYWQRLGLRCNDPCHSLGLQGEGAEKTVPSLSILQVCSFVFWSAMRSPTLKIQQP